MGYEVVSYGNGSLTPTGVGANGICGNIGCPNAGCIDINIICPPTPPTDSFCIKPGLGCRHGCGGATGQSCVNPYSTPINFK